MSASEGALEATLPVAAHMPGGGFASMSFMLAVRILLDAVEVLVPVRPRCFVEGVAAPSELVWRSSGHGNGTGVDMLACGFLGGSGEDIVAGEGFRRECFCCPIPEEIQAS
jgi:hypothetical protein